MADGAFEKDFGYLMPFLEKVAAAANDITDAAAREELKRLVAGEQSRWLRIRELLSGGAAKPAPPVARPAALNAQASVESPAVQPAPPKQFTVGSLRPR
jgi:hypothetical protein